MFVESWKQQLRRLAAEFALLALLEQDELHSIEIAEAFRARPEIGLADAAIYPLLGRLQREGRIQSRWIGAAGAGPPRKFYRLTPEGEAALSAMRPIWRACRDHLNELAGGLV